MLDRPKTYDSECSIPSLDESKEQKSKIAILEDIWIDTEPHMILLIVNSIITYRLYIGIVSQFRAAGLTNKLSGRMCC